MDSSSSPSSQMQQNSQFVLQQRSSTSRRNQRQSDIQPPDSTPEQFQMQSRVEIADMKFDQSQPLPKADYAYALEAEMACLQSEILTRNKAIHNLTYENENLKLKLKKFHECIQILQKHMDNQCKEEKESDRKGKKVLEIDKPKRKLKKLTIYTKKGTDEVVDVLALSDDSDNDNDVTIQDVDSDDEEDVGQIKSALNISRLDGFGSSSKIGVELVELNDIIQSNSRKNYALRTDVSTDEVKKLANSNENATFSYQTILLPDLVKSKSMIEIPEIMKSSKNEANSTHIKRKWDARWNTEEEMFCSLKDEILLEAVCALFRHERKMRLCRSKGMMGLSDSDFEKLKHVTSFLMQHDASGPNRKTTEELENYIKGGVNFCAMLVGTYSRKLFHIYFQKMDDHFC